MSRLRTLRPLDAVEPKFVDNRQIRTRVVAQMCGKRFVGEGSGQVGESLGGSAIQNAVALDADLLSQRLDDVTLSDSTPADQDQVIAAPDEIAAGQFFDLHAVEGFVVELPVEPFQGLAVRKTGFPNAPRDNAFPERVGLCPQQQIEKVQVRETLFLRPGQQLVQPCTFRRNPQSRAVTQTPVTQRGRRFRRFHRGSPFLPIAADTPPWNEWIRETAGGSRRVAPARRPAAIPIRTGGELAPPVSIPPRTRRKRGNRGRAPAPAPGPRGDTWQAGPARVRLPLCHNAECGPEPGGTGLLPIRTPRSPVSTTRPFDGDRVRGNAREDCVETALRGVRIGRSPVPRRSGPH